ncbi:hypothetical protein DSO57_1016151 [Entomophthora muscae]|uniref:Uncharacterized protein n=1 Tax=Entomophthora muscae TaxID=34485 RepID=A0ACC2T5T7_9FUNG|nr:hypothetical protein DSO57_1016151 [Entomophthora muscae]
MGCKTGISPTAINPNFTDYSKVPNPTVFDKIITTSNKSLAQLILDLKSSAIPQANVKVQTPPDATSITKTLKSLSTTDKGMYIRLRNGPFFLETNTNPYNEGTSISHVHLQYSNTQDYLMAKNIPSFFQVLKHAYTKQ